MSIAVMTRVWDGFPTGGPELLAMLALADWSDDTGLCWPSVGTVANRLRISRSQAQRVLHRLATKGYLAIVGNGNGGPPGSTRRYRIELDRLTGRMNATPTGSTDATGSKNATGRMDARDGSHGCTETGRMGATQTVIDPSRTVSVGKSPAKQDSATTADCPHQEIIALYHQCLPSARHVREWTPGRAQALRARWREKPSRQNLDWWRRFFEYVSESDFLMGRTQSPGRKPFCVSLDWLAKAENFAKVLEGAYENHNEDATA